MHSDPLIRPARCSDLIPLYGVEKGVRAMFHDFGVLAHQPDVHTPSSEPGLFEEGTVAWVATDPNDVAVGYVLAYVLDDAAHVAQVSVHPNHQRHGLGRALLGTVERWAADQGLRALTLITYTDVPWNAPWYRRIGFVDVAPADLAIGLGRLLASTAAVATGWQRSVMRRSIAS